MIAIGDFVWRDLDGNGVQGAGEPGLGGVTVELWDEAKSRLLATTTTSATGFWALPAAAGVTYRVRVAGLDLISPRDQGANDALDSDINAIGPDAGYTDAFAPTESTPNVDAGLYIAVGDLVWDDINLNGIREPGEPGLAGVQMQLWNPAKNNLIDTAVTGPSGDYELVAPGPGDYRVRALLPAPATMMYSPKDVGGDDSLDSDADPAGGNMGFTDPFSVAGRRTATVDVGMH